MTSTIVKDYYNHICKEWNVSPTSDTYTGYESVEHKLSYYSKELWNNADEKGKEQIINDVFDIYRSINIMRHDI